MDRASRRLVKDYCVLLAQIHDAVKISLEQENLTVTLDLLGQAQEAAVQIGTIEDEAEGSGFVNIGLQERRHKILEDYCELVYQIYVLLLQGHTLNPQKVWNQLQQWHVRILENVLEEERPEVVFLADENRWTGAMERFWRAVNEDMDCDLYVISIPNDESGMKVRNQENVTCPYPDEALVVPFQEYHFAERHPELICVPFPLPDVGDTLEMQQFFSGTNLKSCTELLIYISCGGEEGRDIRKKQYENLAWDCVDYVVVGKGEKHDLLSESDLCPDVPKMEIERKLFCPDEAEDGEAALYDLIKKELRD